MIDEVVGVFYQNKVGLLMKENPIQTKCRAEKRDTQNSNKKKTVDLLCRERVDVSLVMRFVRVKINGFEEFSFPSQRQISNST